MENQDEAPTEAPKISMALIRIQIVAKQDRTTTDLEPGQAWGVMTGQHTRLPGEAEVMLDIGGKQSKQQVTRDQFDALVIETAGAMSVSPRTAMRSCGGEAITYTYAVYVAAWTRLLQNVMAELVTEMLKSPVPPV